MDKTGLSIMLVVTFALQACAADGPEQGKPPRANAVTVSVLLEQAARSPLGPSEAPLLRAVADLIEKEQDAGLHPSAPPSPAPAIAPQPAPVVRQTPRPMPAAKPAATRQSLVVRLSNIAAVDAAKAVQEFLNRLQKKQDASERPPIPNRAVIVPEPVSNSLLISGPPQLVDSIRKLLLDLDTPPPALTFDVCIAELRPRSGERAIDRRLGTVSATDKTPSMENDGAAWLAWAKKQGRLEVLSQPQVRTLNNQPAFIEIGTIVPISGAGSDGPAKDHQIKQTKVGVTVGLTPRISPDGLVIVELDLQRTSVVTRDGAVGPTLEKSIVQTTISAKDGQTIVVGGLMHSGDDDGRRTVIALTPHVNPKR